MLFSSENRLRFADEATGAPAIARLVSREWNAHKSSNDDTYRMYMQRAQEDRERYAEELAKYEADGGGTSAAATFCTCTREEKKKKCEARAKTVTAYKLFVLNNPPSDDCPMRETMRRWSAHRDADDEIYRMYIKMARDERDIKQEADDTIVDDE